VGVASALLRSSGRNNTPLEWNGMEWNGMEWNGGGMRGEAT